MIRIHLLLVLAGLGFIFNGCSVFVDDMAGGTSTEPLVGTGIHAKVISQVYVFDVSDPYNPIDTVEVDVDGNWSVEDLDLGQQIQVLADIDGLEGDLSDTLTAVKKGEPTVKTILTPEPYELDTLSLSSDEVNINDVQVAFSILPPATEEGGVYVIQSTQGQEQFKVNHSAGESEYKINEYGIEAIKDPIELEFSADQINFDDLYAYVDMGSYNQGEDKPLVGDSIIKFNGKAPQAVLGKDGSASGAASLDSTWFAIAMPDEFLEGDLITVEMLIRPTHTGDHAGIFHFSPVPDTSNGDSRTPDMYVNFGWLRGEVAGGPNEQISNPDVLTIGDWIHVVYQIGPLRPQAIWVDGIKVAEGAETTYPSHDQMKNFIFGYSSMNFFQPIDPYFYGDIDYLRIWKRVLSDAEIQELAL